MNDRVVLVDEKDDAKGSMDKLAVQQKGLLYSAFSIFIFNVWKLVLF